MGKQTIFLILIAFLLVGVYSTFQKSKKIAPQSVTKMKDSLDEVDIMAERFMFSPMMVRLRKGRSTKIVLTTNDVQHGLNVPQLNLNLSAYPGRPAEAMITPQLTGEFTASCSLYCGDKHSDMKMTFIVE
ncbi:MAG: hypothetical protein ABIO02_02215 [Patescibacteria group bacterium]